jgi:hypothetical protein
MSCPWWDNDGEWSPEYRVHVSNLPWRTDEDSLMDAFADYKPIHADVSGHCGRFLLDMMLLFVYFLCLFAAGTWQA